MEKTPYSNNALFHICLKVCIYEIKCKDEINLEFQFYALGGYLFGFTWYPHGISLTFLKLGLWSSGVGFYSYYIHQQNKSDKERKIVRNKVSFMHTKRFTTFFKRLVQLRVGAIPRLPLICMKSKKIYSFSL